MTGLQWFVVLLLILFVLKFIEYKWEQLGVPIPYLMKKMGLALIGIAAILLVFSAEKKQNTVYTANYHTVRIIK